MKTYGACPAMPSLGSARTVGIRMDSGISDSILDLKTDDRRQMSEVSGQISEDRSQILGDK